MNARRITALCLLAALVFAWRASAAPTSAVTASVQKLTFSAYVGSESLPQKVTFTNTGKEAIEVHGATIRATDDTLFAVRDDCPTTLVPTQYCTAVVIFTPGHAGHATATLEFADRTIAVSGTGVVSKP
jgi:hypothetical protein